MARFWVILIFQLPPKHNYEKDKYVREQAMYAINMSPHSSTFY